jgi:aconitate hydratase
MAMTERNLTVNGKTYRIFDVSRADIPDGPGSLPYSIRILLENVLRKEKLGKASAGDVQKVLAYRSKPGQDIPYYPARVLMQDFTGVPAVVDLAAMRNAMVARGGDPKKINPLIPVDLVIDHSVQIDFWQGQNALQKNVEMEYTRNSERYRLLKWAAESMDNFRVVPPNSGICHQINFENLGRIVRESDEDGTPTLFPDTLIGTDSHTTMIDGLGIMGWGVGGIEAEAVLLGQAYVMPVPEVIGVKLSGSLPAGTSASDLVLTLTEMLRKEGVVGKFVEYFGPGMSALPLPDRATVANMSPEYGATMGFFPVDDKTIRYLKETGREEAAVLSEAYLKETGMFFSPDSEPLYNKVLHLDLGSVRPSLAGPYRPQDRIDVSNLPKIFGAELEKNAPGSADKTVPAQINGTDVQIPHGAVAIASITSCTNTSNPFVMVGAGLLAKKARARGLKPPVWVKTSLAPGSQVVLDYLERAGLVDELEGIGFTLSAFGCATCIGNSGPLPDFVTRAIDEGGLLTASVSSGNRNFEARIHQKVRFNFLGSPLYVVAYALAGRVDMDIMKEPIGRDTEGKEVYLKEIWPSSEEIEAVLGTAVKADDFVKRYTEVFKGDDTWRSLKVDSSELFPWDPESTYIREPDLFFDAPEGDPGVLEGARALGVFGDSITTDHISPAGTIAADYPAGRYLQEKGVPQKDFNSYGSRRGNHEVMMRGTFGNIRIKNQLVPEKTGGYTRRSPEGEIEFIYDAAIKYAEEGTPLIVLAGKEYGTGSSRDWAAKGPRLQGVRAVIAESFERIHRSNLVGMGVLPLCFTGGDTISSLGLTGFESYSISGLGDFIPGTVAEVTALSPEGKNTRFKAALQIYSSVEADFIRSGGVLPYVLEELK